MLSLGKSYFLLFVVSIVESILGVLIDSLRVCHIIVEIVCVYVSHRHYFLLSTVYLNCITAVKLVLH